MRRPEPHGRDDGGEVVVGDDERGRLARHVGAAAAHCHADVGRLEGGRVVHAVAGHRDDLARGAERLHEAQLLLGHDPREHRGAASALAERRVVEGVELRPGADRLARRARPGARWRAPSRVSRR